MLDEKQGTRTKSLCLIQQKFSLIFSFFSNFPSFFPSPPFASFFLLNQSQILSCSYFSFIISPSHSFLHFFSFLHFSFSRFLLPSFSFNRFLLTSFSFYRFLLPLFFLFSFSPFFFFLFSFSPVYGMNVYKMIIVWMHNKLMNNYHLDFYSLACLSNICFTEPVTFAFFIRVFHHKNMNIYILYKHFVNNTIYWIKKWWNKIINFYLILNTRKAFAEIL